MGSADVLVMLVNNSGGIVDRLSPVDGIALATTCGALWDIRKYIITGLPYFLTLCDKTIGVCWVREIISHKYDIPDWLYDYHDDFITLGWLLHNNHKFIAEYVKYMRLKEYIYENITTLSLMLYTALQYGYIQLAKTLWNDDVREHIKYSCATTNSLNVIESYDQYGPKTVMFERLGHNHNRVMVAIMLVNLLLTNEINSFKWLCKELNITNDIHTVIHMVHTFNNKCISQLDGVYPTYKEYMVKRGHIEMYEWVSSHVH